MQPTAANMNELDLFRSQLSSQLDMNDPIIRLGALLPWSSYEEMFGHHYTEKQGSPGKPIRLMVGLLLLGSREKLSDQRVVLLWKQNPYWQYFCGYNQLQLKMPIHPSSLSRFRQRIGQTGLEKILSSTVSVAKETGAVKAKDCEQVSVDTTVMEKNIKYPTDSMLLHRARSRLVSVCRRRAIKLKQSYVRVGRKQLNKAQGYAHAKQSRRLARANKQLKTYLRRVVSEIKRKSNAEEFAAFFEQHIVQAERLLKQTRDSKNKLYSLHEPDVVCISKGKAHKRYEFGRKVSVVATQKQGLVLSCQALAGNPFDGHTLVDAVADANAISSVQIKQVFVDRGYRGHAVPKEQAEVFISGQKRGVTPALKRAIKRRSAIEPLIGHMKSDGKMDICRLKGFQGDVFNALLCGIAQNLRLLIAWIFSPRLFRAFFHHFYLISSNLPVK